MHRFLAFLLVLVTLATPQIPAAYAKPNPNSNSLLIAASTDGGIWYDHLSTQLPATGIMETAADFARLAPALKRPVLATFETCGDANAWYSPQTQAITMCYDYLWWVFFHMEFDLEATWAVARFVLLHEATHALIDVNKLSLPGMEEYNADQLAAVTLIRAGNPLDVLAAAAYFESEADPSDAYWTDGHPPPTLRAANLRCLVLGSNPDAWAELVPLLGWRSVWCADEYTTAVAAWSR